MSKFVFLACAFLLFGVSYAVKEKEIPKKENISLEHVQADKQKFIDFISRAEEQINQKVKNIPKEMSENTKKLTDEAVNVAKSLYEKIISVQKKVNSEVEKVLSTTVGVNVTVCAELTQTFDAACLQILSESTRCLTDVVKTSEGYIEDNFNNSKNVLKNLISVKDEAEICVKDAKCPTSASECVKQTVTKGTWTVIKEATSFYLNCSNLSSKIASVMPKLTTCTATNFEKVEVDSSKMVEKVKECIETQKAIEESKKCN